jgi:hypothetical protein
MSDQEWDRKMNELRDSQLVTQRLLDQLEVKMDDTNEQVRALTSVVLQHESRFDKHDDEMAEIRAALASLISNIDRFIQGRQANGH